MKVSKVDFAQTNQFSSLFQDYITEKSQLKEFYNLFPRVENFEDQIKQKQFSEESRSVLVDALKEQYQHIGEEPENIELLAEDNTFTVTTGHQLNIFTGPLYFIYKIVTVINTCKDLKHKYPDYNFVPIYWMATEDHDFDEISYFRLNGKKHIWKTEQTGAVGRFNTKQLQQILAAVPGMPKFFINAYTKSKNLAEAVRSYVHHLFGEHGIVVVDGDHPKLKAALKPVIREDIFETAVKPMVDEQSTKLEETGYKTQVYARDINFFYLKDDVRERIEEVDGKYQVLNTEISFGADELSNLIDQNPEYFSPNVILRPLYQELILPNLAYAGGPSEVGYWLQLKTIFDHFKVAFPMLMPRNFALVLTSPIETKMGKVGISIEDLFKPKSKLEAELVTKSTEKDIQLNGQKDAILEWFDKIKAQAQAIDPTLSQHVEAQQTKTANRLDIIEKKFIRAEKKNQSDRMRQLSAVLDEIFPNGTPQERIDNFLNFYILNPDFVNELIAYLEPLDFRFNIVHHD